MVNTTIDTDLSGLSPELRREFLENQHHPVVGQTLVAVTELARVWFICLQPGQRLGFHRHVLDYFWTALTAGAAESHVNGGPPQRSEYTPGLTKHFRFKRGEHMIHDLRNVGETALLFNTVEFLNSANRPLPLPPLLKPGPIPVEIQVR